MFCPKCGTELSDTAKFCGSCGTEIAGSSIEKNNKRNSGKKVGKVFFALFAAALFAAGGVGATLFVGELEKADDNVPDEVLEQLEGETEMRDSLPADEDVAEMGNSLLADQEETESEQDIVQLQTEGGTENDGDVYAVFGITEGAAESYESALNTNAYQYYNSGIANFRFFYPAALYCDVVYDEQETETPYGMNVQTISFVGSAGSESTFSLSRYADEVSIEEMSEKIYSAETAALIDAADVVYGIYEDHGRIIVTGYEGEDLKPVYNLFYVDSEYVMRMKIVFSVYRGVEDELQKAYVTECMYRLCGFSGSTANCRSYETFKTETLGLEDEIVRIQGRYPTASMHNMEIAALFTGRRDGGKRGTAL